MSQIIVVTFRAVVLVKLLLSCHMPCASNNNNHICAIMISQGKKHSFRTCPYGQVSFLVFLPGIPSQRKSLENLASLHFCCIHPSSCTHPFVQAGGSVQQRKIKDLSEIAPEVDLVVNCAGLGSKQLFKDDKLTAVRWVTVCAVAFLCTLQL